MVFQKNKNAASSFRGEERNNAPLPGGKGGQSCMPPAIGISAPVM